MIKIYGASDDLIEIEGDITEEFNVYIEEDESVILAVSDGTLLKVRYDGCWRIHCLRLGLATYNKTYEAKDREADKYSDEVELTEIEIEWVGLVDKYYLKKILTIPDSEEK